jgi:hypothetical protein
LSLAAPTYDEPALHLSRISIRNIRCFASLDIDLTVGDGGRNWALIFGDNGVGKTTLLRSIAMGMCDESSAAGLLREIYGDWHRLEGGQPLPSEIHLEFASSFGPASITTRIEPKISGYSQVKQTAQFAGRRTEFPWDLIFACGYGAARRSFGTTDVADYATIDAVYTLFNYDTPLQNPELVIRRLASSFRNDDESAAGDASGQAAEGRIRSIDALLDSISCVLMLEPGSIKMTPKGLTIAGPWGTFQPVGGLGDGFQATLSWMSDFLGWALLFNEERPLDEVRGIVLMDELEQHLHPRWQAQIVSLLHRQFPHIQFIATTHTPMCALGATELPDESCELVKLQRGEDCVFAIENVPVPRGQRADQVLTSLLFELPTAGDNATVRDISRFNSLSVKAAKTGAEETELASLRESLAARFSASESEFETTIKREVRAALKRQGDETIHNMAADFEVLRQLRELANEKD